jgi:hypothetical protein
MNTPVMISTQRQLNTVFGYPHPESGDPYLIYAASQYLLTANEAFVVRVGVNDPVDDEQAQLASVDLPAAGSTIDVWSSTPGPYSFDAVDGSSNPLDYFFRWRLNGVLSSKILVVLNDANRPSPNTNFAYQTQELVDVLNNQLDLINDGIEFYAHDLGGGNTSLGVVTTFAYGPSASLEFVSVQQAIYGGSVAGGNVTGLGTGMTPATLTGANDRYPNDGYHAAGTWDFTGLTNLNLQVVITGTDNVLVDDVLQVIDLSALAGNVNTTTQVVNAINNQIALLPGGFVCTATGNNITLTTLAKGNDSRMLVKSVSTAAAIFGFDALTHQGNSPVGTTGDPAITTFGIILGAPNTSGLVSLTITADSPGIDGNNTVVTIKNDIRQGIFTMQVFNNGAQVEAWGNLTKDPASRFYVPTYLALVSDWVRAIDHTAVLAPPADNTAPGYALSGGTDGIPSDPDKQDSLIIGNPTAGTGLYIFSEPEQIDIDLLAAPGHASTNVILALIDVCQTYRQDCLAIVDPPFGLTVNEIIQWQNGAHPLNTVRFDTDFGALYWPWVKIRDSFNQIDVWVPPSGSVLAAIARSDFLAFPWFAPAGLTRGIVPGVTDVFNRPTLAERDLMYGNRNCINPIIQFVDISGFVIWGQKTLQRRPTALDRVNVRRMLFVAEKQIRAASRALLFEPNDQTFQDQFTQIATAILHNIQVNRGIHAFIIQDDDTLNTPDVVDRNEFRARIGVQPTHAVEFMFIEFSIHRTGDFSEPDNGFGF